MTRSGALPLSDIVSEFEAKRFSPAFREKTPLAERRTLLERIRQAAASAAGATINADAAGVFTLKLDGAVSYAVRYTLENDPPFRIASMAIHADADAKLKLDKENLEREVDAFMGRGRSGLIYVAIDGRPILRKAYGMAIAELGIPNTPSTNFDIGSRPIDFTIAAIFLLEQQGKLNRDQTLADYFENVPSDRAGMTLRQLMTGQSGLPDFPNNPTDWDSDLGWITREEFERRTMEIPLLFAPGQGKQHSHWAFGVLADIVERVSGQRYHDFLRTNFFEPAGMRRTGEYGSSVGLGMTDFAAGHGQQRGLPNIPPNWGPTSWLVRGSGGMVSTLEDLQAFYRYITTSGKLRQDYVDHFLNPSANLDGSDRGFSLFSTHDEKRSDEVYVFFNKNTGAGDGEPLRRALGALIREN